MDRNRVTENYLNRTHAKLLEEHDAGPIQHSVCWTLRKVLDKNRQKQGITGGGGGGGHILVSCNGSVCCDIVINVLAH